MTDLGVGSSDWLGGNKLPQYKRPTRSGVSAIVTEKTLPSLGVASKTRMRPEVKEGKNTGEAACTGR